MKPTTRKLDRLDTQKLASNPRATLASWLKYRDIVVSAYNQHPRPFIYKPVNMTPASVASKIRDAIRGCIAFGYDCNGIPHVDLSRWWTEIIVKYDSENIFIGPPDEVQNVLSGESVSRDGGWNFPTLTFEEVSAFQLLLSGGRLVGPVKVLQPPDLTLLPKRPNVEFMDRPDGSLVML